MELKQYKDIHQCKLDSEVLYQEQVTPNKKKPKQLEPDSAVLYLEHT